jgi:hypothetical protein
MYEILARHVSADLKEAGYDAQIVQDATSGIAAHG